MLIIRTHYFHLPCTDMRRLTMGIRSEKCPEIEEIIPKPPLQCYTSLGNKLLEPNDRQVLLKGSGADVTWVPHRAMYFSHISYNYKLIIQCWSAVGWQDRLMDGSNPPHILLHSSSDQLASDLFLTVDPVSHQLAELNKQSINMEPTSRNSSALC